MHHNIDNRYNAIFSERDSTIPKNVTRASALNNSAIVSWARNNYNKEVVFPEKYYGDLDDIVLINHQLTDWHDLDDLLRDIYSYDHDFLEEVLSPSSKIVIGRD